MDKGMYNPIIAEIRHLEARRNHSARTVWKRIEKRFKKLEPALRKSITFDRGKENSEHKQLTENTEIPVYFCHPHSPWEKGDV
jgi:IS30 family transposase